LLIVIVIVIYIKYSVGEFVWSGRGLRRVGPPTIARARLWLVIIIFATC